MKYNALYLLLLLLLSGCPLDNEQDDQPKPEQNCKLAYTTTTATFPYGPSYPDYSEKLKYSYNDRGLLTSITSVDSTSRNIRLFYDAQDRLVREQSGPFTVLTTYNEKGQPGKQVIIDQFAPGREEVEYLVHTYDSADQLQESRAYAQEHPSDALLYTYKYTYANGQITQLDRVSGQDDRYDIYTFSYDQNKRPVPALPLQLFYDLSDERLPLTGLLPHNITKQTVQHNNGEPAFESYQATYKYNAAGYPTTATKTYTNGIVRKVQYTYGCP